ncbi:hypothetical protein ACLOJK_019366 [Asimina triloba]
MHAVVKSHKGRNPPFPQNRLLIFIAPKSAFPWLPTLPSCRQPFFISSSTSNVLIPLPSMITTIFYPPSTSSTSDKGSISQNPSPLIHLLLPLLPAAADTALPPAAILHFFLHFRRLPPLYEQRHFLPAINFIDV